MNAGGEAPVETTQTRATQLLYGLEDARRLREQVADVDGLAPWCERLQIPRPSGEHVHRAVMIPSLHMVHRHADLKDALIESSNLT